MSQFFNETTGEHHNVNMEFEAEARNNSHNVRSDGLLFPIVIPQGSVFYDSTHLTVKTSVCFNPICEPQSVENVQHVVIPGDAISIYATFQYFHFFYETVIQLFPLIEYGIFEKYPNATILCFGAGYFSERNIEMLNALEIRIPLNKIRKGKQNILYSVAPTSSMIVARHNDYHSKTPQSLLYNRNVINLIRGRLTLETKTPDMFLYVSRQGIRRGIQQERELYTGLKAIFPNLTFFLPDNYTVPEQRKVFERSRVIIAPHGASLTNVIFSDWEKLTLIELTTIERPATFRNDLEVRDYFLVKCPAAPCRFSRARRCDFQKRDMDINVTMTIDIIQNIVNNIHDKTKALDKDYVVNGSNSL
jgi:hypothetical protein